MYRKLLKHDWRSSRGVLGLMCLTCLGASVLGGISMRSVILLEGGEDMEAFLAFLNMMGLMMSFVVIGVCYAGALFFLIWRFYKSRYSDEGYLTFTLPVSTHQVLLSSLTNTVLSMLLMFIAVFLSVSILVALGFTAIPEFYSQFFAGLSVFWDGLNQITKEEPGFFIALLLYTPACALGEVIVMMLSVTIGSVIVRKYKVLAAVGVYYGINMVLSFVISISTFSGLLFSNDAMNLMGGTFLVPTVLMAAVGIGGYFLMYYMASRKLNLP